MSADGAGETSPQTAYRQIVDELVALTTGVAERLIRSEARFSNAPGDRHINDFVASLTVEQQQVLADICRSQRMGGIHDTLALLGWWVDCRGLVLSVEGTQLVVDENGCGPHGDYVGRLDGWDWPELPT
jgi:hypothetical protein